MTKFSWDDIEKLSYELADKVKASGFAPDYLIGITTGGLIPLALVAKRLGSKNLLTVSASSYNKQEQKELQISNIPKIDMSGKKVLLIDEIADTGVTLKKISEILLAECHIGELRTAVIAVSEGKCDPLPDYFILSDINEWLVFPWDRDEYPEYFN